MSYLDRQIHHARRRLTHNVFFHRFSLGLLVTGGLWALTILVVRLLALGVPLVYAGYAAALLALLVGLVGTLLARPSPLHAAVTLDAAAGLKERLSTAWLIRRDGDPFARAAVQDAEKAAGSVHVPAHIPRHLPPLWPWSAATVVSALLLAWFMPTVDLLAAQRKPETVVPRAQVEAEQLAIKTEFEQKLNKLKELSKDNPELDKLLDDVQVPEMPEGPNVTPDDVRRKAVQRIDDVREKLQRELEQGGDEALKEARRAFNKLNEPGEKPAGDKLSQTLATGDFSGAKQALEDIAKDIEDAAKHTDSPEAQQKLAQMQEQLQKLANQLSELSDTTHLQKELENKAGLTPEEAKKLLNELSKMDPKQLEKELQKRLGDKGVSQKQVQDLAKKMQQQQQSKKSCQNLSQALSKAAQAAQQCQSPGSAGSGSADAANALSDAASQLSDMEMSEQLMNELQAQISDLEKMRDSVCKGDKCPGKCPGGNPGPIGEQGPNLGLGLGSHVGKEKTAYQTDAQKAKTRYQGGAIIGRMLVEGPQVRGQATAEQLSAAQAEVRDQMDAVEREEVPRQYQRALREYFERLAGLMRAQQDNAPPSSPPPPPEKQP